ncbi:TonB-dependent receptor family protein [Herbaspirillum robiniae]|uniref:TonB-dependent siderophore receptor n=1 Tax=Herbaspirillum robiniae TaxID=2014887 RepID=A0A246WVL4_9BURK|nr:TonB-dependent siderophore receptor [Herbaspirillum robiniae]OWY31119.1 TonB-dependent siderophore receptor [Herbaspirillum robiniae]
MKTIRHRALNAPRTRCAAAISLALLAFHGAAAAQQASTQDAQPGLETIQVSGDWLGTGLDNSVKTYPGARTVVKKQEIESTGAVSIGDLMRRIPGVQASDNSGTAGSAIALNIGVRGLTGRYSPRSTILLDGIPMAVAPYGQPQLSFVPLSMNNIESVDVVRGGGAVRFGPQNVGGIINFKTRSIPTTPGISGDAALRYNSYAQGGGNTQYSAFAGGQNENGFGMAFLYSGQEGSGWRNKSDERVNDFALKMRYEISPTSELYAKLSYYDVLSRTPGGLTVAQYNADPFQNTRQRDNWSGTRKGFDVGYLNTISDNQEFEIRTYFNQANRQSTLINAAGTSLTHQPRNYETLGIEPRYTQRFALGGTTNDVTVGYRYIRERGDDNAYNEAATSGALSGFTTFQNSTDAHAAYIDDKIAFGKWRITPGLRFEHIQSTRYDVNNKATFQVANNKPLPSINLAYLLTEQLTLFTNYNTSFGVVQNTQLNTMSANNPLSPELAKTIEGGARWKSDRVSAEATVFHIDFDNQIASVPGTTPTVFRNLGKTQHDGIELAVDYAFDKESVLKGWSVYANYTYTRALQKSGTNSGKDVPFYSRTTDTVGTRFQSGPWGFNLSTTHQGRQFADEANTVAESADGSTGEIPGFRIWNAQVDWKVPGAKGFDVFAGVNNLTDRRYFTRTTDGNLGKLVGAPRTIYVQGRYAF